MSLLMENAYAKIGCGDPGDPIETAALFKNAFMSRAQPADGNRRKGAISGWFKRTLINDRMVFLEAFETASLFTAIGIIANRLNFSQQNNPSFFASRSTVGHQRGAAAHSHAFVYWDTEQALEVDRFGVILDGLPQSLTGTVVPQNFDLSLFKSGVTHRIGRYTDGAINAYDYLEDLAIFEGVIPDYEDFGRFNSDGHWVYKTFSGEGGGAAVYGTYGSHHKFTNPINPGEDDASGNGNDFVISSGVIEVVGDTPATNIATLDPNNPRAGTLSNGNRTVGTPTTAVADETATLSIPVGGNFGWRATPKSSSGSAGYGIGIRGANADASTGAYQSVPSVIYRSNGQKYVNGVATAYGSAFGADDPIDVRYDGKSQTIEFKVDGVSQGTIPLPALEGKFIPAFDDFGSGTVTFDVDFETPPESPFEVLATANYPCPAILNPETYVARRECIGGAGVSDLAFSPLTKDVVIFSGRRDLETDWRLNYSIAGVLQDPICTNDPAAGPIVGEDGLTLTANGFDVGAATPYQGTCWHRIFRVGGLGGLSVTRVNHTGGTTTAPHGSGGPIAYGLIIPRAGGDIRVFHHKADAGDYWLLNSNAGFANDPGWFVSSANDLTLGGALPVGEYDVIGWTEVDQFSSFSKIKGNGLVNGPQDICDYVPLLMFGRKQGAGESNWIMDRKVNPVTTMQYLNGTTILYSSSGYSIDFNSNGLKWRTDSSSWNPSGGYVFTSSWAAVPAKFATAQ